MGVVLISPQNYVIPHAFLLTEPCSNNVAEYNAILIGMQNTDEIGVKNLEVYGDAKLIINQVRRKYEVRHEDLVLYHNATIHMTEKFKASILTMYLSSKIHMQMHWRLSPLP